jgi:hypothetical protein
VSILAALFVLALWFFPKSIARGLLPLASDAPAKPSGPELWFAAGAGLIGVWLAASALPGLARNLFVMYLFRAESGQERPGSRHRVSPGTARGRGRVDPRRERHPQARLVGAPRRAGLSDAVRDRSP